MTLISALTLISATLNTDRDIASGCAIAHDTIDNVMPQHRTI